MKLTTCDAHIDTPWIATKYGSFTLLDGSPRSFVSHSSMMEGGLSSAVFALYISDYWQDMLPDHLIDQMIDEQIMWVKNQNGITFRGRRGAKGPPNGGLSAFIGLEGGQLIHESLSRLGELARAGICYMTLVHNRDTSWASSSTSIRHTVLTPFGEEVVKEMEGLGILVDLSHVSDETCVSVLGIATEPVIASHSGCRVLNPHPRNLSNEIIKGIAMTGGIIHIPFAEKFVGTMAGIAEHIDHVTQLVGIDHVGIGSDIDGAIMVDGFEGASQWYDTFAGPLTLRGYSDSDIIGVAGGNTLRLLNKEV